MIFRSPHPDLLVPTHRSVPSLLLSPTDHRTSRPILYPTPAADTARPEAKPLSIAHVRSLAYAFAAALLTGALGGREWKKGDLLVIYAQNQHDYPVAVLGALLAGGTVALCNPAYKPSELAHQLRMTRARLILCTSIVYSNAQRAASIAASHAEDEEAKDVEGLEPLEDAPGVYTFEERHESSWHELLKMGEEAGEEGRKAVEAVRISPQEDTAILCFSSGTSGPPKAVRLSHLNLVSNIIQSTFMLRDRLNPPLLDEGNWYGTATTNSGASTPIFARSRDVVANAVRRLPELLLTATNASAKDKTETESKTGANEAKTKSQRVEKGGESHIDILPQFHCYGLVVVFVALHTATPRVILPRFDLEVFLSTVQERKVTFAFVVPPILLALAKSPVVDKYDISSLRRVASGAASLPVELREAVHKRLGIVTTDGYGMSEMSPIIALQKLEDLERGPGTVGVLAPSTEAKIVDPDGKELGFDEEGELYLRGPQQMQGYLNNDEANSLAFTFDSSPSSHPQSQSPASSPSSEVSDPASTKADRAIRSRSKRWLRTGDVARINSKGYIQITDRLKDVIKYHGFQVSPSELEGLLINHPLVADVAVLGVTDKEGNELPWAFVVRSSSAAFSSPSSSPSSEKSPSSETAGGAGGEGKAEGKGGEAQGETEEGDTKTIMEHVNSRVAGYKKIRGVTWVEKLPKSDAGKILKRELRDKAHLPS